MKNKIKKENLKPTFLLVHHEKKKTFVCHTKEECKLAQKLLPGVEIIDLQKAEEAFCRWVARSPLPALMRAATL